MIRPVSTDAAPTPAGHYSQAVRAGDALYISGQLPILADGTRLTGRPVEEQARAALSNLLAILAAAGGNPGDLVRVTAYIVGVENWPLFNTVYAEMMGEARPARTVVPVPELHHGVLVEVDGIALLSEGAQ